VERSNAQLLVAVSGKRLSNDAMYFLFLQKSFHWLNYLMWAADAAVFLLCGTGTIPGDFSVNFSVALTSLSTRGAPSSVTPL